MTTARCIQMLWAVPFLIAVHFVSIPAYAQYSGGTGEPNDPYQIGTAADLTLLGKNPEDYDKHFILAADIDLDPKRRGRRVFDRAIIGPDANDDDTQFQGALFTGIFDGNNHVIRNLTINTRGVDSDYLGLFGNIGETGLIKNLGIEGANIVGGDDSWFVGALAGANDEGGIITSCYAAASISGRRMLGALLGANDGTMIGCHATGSVSGVNYLGGLTAWNSGTIASCSSGADLSGNGWLGGLVAANVEQGTIGNCYATGSVSGNHSLGGLVADSTAIGRIVNCYSIGKVTGSGSGLVAGFPGTARDSFWDVQTSGQRWSHGGTGKTTAEMQDANTFLAAGWDFVGEFGNGPSDHWALPAGGGYPVLWWQLPSLPPLPEFSGGTGKTDDPYLISSPEDLNRIGHNPRLMETQFRLIDHVDLTGVEFFIVGNSVFPFSGVFDGNNKHISGFSHTIEVDEIGLFGYVNGEDAQIKDVGLTDPNVSARDDVGSLVGYLEKGTISNCRVEGGSVAGKRFVGGLVGTNSGTVNGCQSSANVSGEGGLVGRNMKQGAITNCHATGSVLGDRGVGGLAGYNHAHAKIMYSYSEGDVAGNENVGGLAGFNAGRIAGCYSVGGVTGVERVGGLVGNNIVGSVLASYSMGAVLGTENVGGLIGIGGGAYSSYWDTQTSGLLTSYGGEGRTGPEMHMASTFVGWGHDPVWTIDEGEDYPRLRWQNMPGEIVTTASPFEAVAGSGTEVDPYLIYTAQELDLVGQFPYAWDKHFKLMADIDLGGYSGEAFHIIGRSGWPFSGVFDGDDKVIMSFSYTSPLTHGVGLFHTVRGESAHIKDLGFIDPNIDAGAGSAIGPLAGVLSRNGTISNCYAEGGSVRGSDYVGGLVGENWGTIVVCYATGSVSGEDWGIGGLAGISPGTIINSHASGSVSGTRNVGGLTGNSADAITNSYATGTVFGSDRVGGLVGSTWGSVTNSYATGSVAGISFVGGLAGRNTRTITYCYSAGSVSGTSDFGGLVGGGAGTVVLSFWDTQASGQTASDGGVPKTTAEMQSADTFLEAGWDFMDETANGTEDIWWMFEGQSYPKLWWDLIAEN